MQRQVKALGSGGRAIQVPSGESLPDYGITLDKVPRARAPKGWERHQACTPPGGFAVGLRRFSYMQQ